MNIGKAIKDLQARVDGEFSIKGKDDCEDMKLGIEALKRISAMRAGYRDRETDLLEGETED